MPLRLTKLVRGRKLFRYSYLNSKTKNSPLAGMTNDLFIYLHISMATFNCIVPSVCLALNIFGLNSICMQETYTYLQYLNSEYVRVV